MSARRELFHAIHLVVFNVEASRHPAEIMRDAQNAKAGGINCVRRDSQSEKGNDLFVALRLCDKNYYTLKVVKVLDFQDAYAICDVKRVGQQDPRRIELIAAIPHFIDSQIDPALWEETV